MVFDSWNDYYRRAKLLQLKRHLHRSWRRLEVASGYQWSMLVPVGSNDREIGADAWCWWWAWRQSVFVGDVSYQLDTTGKDDGDILLGHRWWKLLVRSGSATRSGGVAQLVIWGGRWTKVGTKMFLSFLPTALWGGGAKLLSLFYFLCVGSKKAKHWPFLYFLLSFVKLWAVNLSNFWVWVWSDRFFKCRNTTTMCISNSFKEWD